MKVYKVRPEPGFNAFTEKDLQVVMDWLSDSVPGDVHIIETQEMSEEEYNALPEYLGS